MQTFCETVTQIVKKITFLAYNNPLRIPGTLCCTLTRLPLHALFLQKPLLTLLYHVRLGMILSFSTLQFRITMIQAAVPTKA